MRQAITSPGTKRGRCYSSSISFVLMTTRCDGPGRAGSRTRSAASGGRRESRYSERLHQRHGRRVGGTADPWIAGRADRILGSQRECLWLIGAAVSCRATVRCRQAGAPAARRNRKSRTRETVEAAVVRLNGFTRTHTLNFGPDNDPVAPKGHQKCRITQRLLSTTPRCRQPIERESTGHRLPE